MIAGQYCSILVLAVVILYVNRRAYRRIKELEDT